MNANNKIINSLEDIPKEFINTADWYNITKKLYLSEEFIENYQDIIDWNLVSSYQILSESFI